MLLIHRENWIENGNYLFKEKRRDIHIALKEKYLFKRKYIDNNSGTLQIIFWDGDGLKKELLDAHNTKAVIELMGKHNAESCHS